MATLRLVAIAIFVLWIVIDGVVVFRRRSAPADNRDRFSLRVVMAGNMLWMVIAFWVAFTPYGAIAAAIPLQLAGIAVMAIGILLRSVAIAQLGRFHTPNVAVLTDHVLMDRGLYRHIRHPSYLGALITFFGLGLALGNWISLAVTVLLPPLIYLIRIHEEEQALCTALGARYTDYCDSTKRLIPSVY
jgi:protein-S-isoprenylcysteine O-methyltransferase